MAASERSDEGAGADVGGEAEARRRRVDGRQRPRCNSSDTEDDDRGAALVDASAVERPAAAVAATRIPGIGVQRWTSENGEMRGKREPAFRGRMQEGEFVLSLFSSLL